MTTKQYAGILQEVRCLGGEEQRRLLADLSEFVRQAEDQAMHPSRSILELDGRGKESWAEVDRPLY